MYHLVDPNQSLRNLCVITFPVPSELERESQVVAGGAGSAVMVDTMESYSELESSIDGENLLSLVRHALGGEGGGGGGGHTADGGGRLDYGVGTSESDKLKPEQQEEGNRLPTERNKVPLVSHRINSHLVHLTLFSSISVHLSFLCSSLPHLTLSPLLSHIKRWTCWFLFGREGISGYQHHLAIQTFPLLY